MARYIALFALVVGASALQTVQLETLQQTSEMLNNMLADFEKKENLKDAKVYAEYVAIREGAKQAAAAVKEFATRFPPAPNDWHNDDDELEVEDIEADKVEAALKAKKQEEQLEDDKLEQEEPKEEAKKVDKKTAQKLKLDRKLAVQAESRTMTKAEKLKKFQSPYRTASAKEAKEVKLLDEGTGTYGRFGDIILGSSLIETEEEPKKAPTKTILSLEDTIAKREKEMREETILYVKSIEQAKLAKKLCAGDVKCIEKVDKKLQKGVFVRDLKAKLEGNKKF